MTPDAIFSPSWYKAIKYLAAENVDNRTRSENLWFWDRKADGVWLSNVGHTRRIGLLDSSGNSKQSIRKWLNLIIAKPLLNSWISSEY